MYYRDSYYYLFYSHAQCCGLNRSKLSAGQEYMVKVCRSIGSTGEFVTWPSSIAFSIVTESYLDDNIAGSVVFHALTETVLGRSKRHILHEWWRNHCPRKPPRRVYAGLTVSALSPRLCIEGCSILRFRRGVYNDPTQGTVLSCHYITPVLLTQLLTLSLYVSSRISKALH